ncbi:uncharacterized protein LOC110709574 [Chenopodium quinoa]|uniref:uncharacterized protein LOC110709574 n=1 Tax=Chenopodium quinoa TaxID=63459 RepID=UPI000B78E052|nr:uncharacterized protein LOC110709574 [Chenopodium quinoa]
MAEEIVNLYSRLCIREEEKKSIDLGALTSGEEENNLSLMLVGKLLTHRSYNVEAFKKTITSIWSPIHGLAIRVLSPNLYAFQFFHWKDLDKVLRGRPWCFDNMLVLLKEIDGDEQPEDVTLTHSPFWVRIKNQPFNCRSNSHVRAIVEGMGKVMEIEEDILGIGRYRRVRLMLNITKPLKRFQEIKDRRGRESYVNFAYERLPFFCFSCGIMGHAERECHNVTEEDRQEQLGWSLDLKATPRKGMSKEMEEIENLKDSRLELDTEGEIALKTRTWKRIGQTKQNATEVTTDAPTKRGSKELGSIEDDTFGGKRIKQGEVNTMDVSMAAVIGSGQSRLTQ